MKKALQYVFVLCTLLALTMGLVKTVFFPKDMNYYENRYAVKLETPTLQGFLEGTVQENVEDALNDQVNFAQYMKKLYNLGSSAFLKLAAQPVLRANPDRYVVLGGNLVYGVDHLLYWPRQLSAISESLDAKIDHCNQVFASHPDTDFYLYYIEKDTDIHFETGARLGAGAYLREGMDLPAERMGVFSVETFDQFSRWFYRTDHHWNAQGSYEGYRQVLAMLKPQETPLEPQEEVTLPGRFSGSKAKGLLESFSETVTVYRFDYPEMEITVNGQPAEDYGKQDLYLSGKGGTPTYGGFYGGDSGEILFDTGTQGRGNILVLGESYDNAILKLLASHYDKTCSVDLRYYENYMGHPFDLDSYLTEHEIDTVLLIGNVDYYVMAEFNPGGQNDGIQ